MNGYLISSWSYNQRPEVTQAQQGFFFLPQTSAVCCGLHLYSQTPVLRVSTSLCAIVHRTFNNAQLCFRRAVSWSPHTKEPTVVVYWEAAVRAGKPQHTCILLCINTVIHTGGRGFIGAGMEYFYS